MEFLHACRHDPIAAQTIGIDSVWTCFSGTAQSLELLKTIRTGVFIVATNWKLAGNRNLI